MTEQLSPTPIFKAFTNGGMPLSGGLLYTYAAGTTTPQASYQDSIGTPNTNPIVLNFRGECALWLDPSLTYKFLLTDSLGNTIPGYPVDNIPGGFFINQQIIGQFLYPPTAGEIAAGATIVNYFYPPYTVDRYATNTVPGSTDMYEAIFTADASANQGGGANVIFLPGGLYGVDITAHAAALTISTSWACNGPAATIQRTDTTAATAYFLAIANQVNNITIRGLTFDGQVTTVAASPTPNVDLGPVGSYNDNGTEDLWTQAYGVRLAMTQNCTVEDCLFINFLRAGLRIDSGSGGSGATGPPWPQTISLGNRVVNCKTQRTRGVFGDGFYGADLETIQYANCYAYDYQRQGFVNELGTYYTNGAQYVNCTADFGHDAVSPESNVGFWSESVSQLMMTNCESKDTGVGWVVNSVANVSQGVFRPYTGTVYLNGCSAIRCNSSGYKLDFGGNRDVHCVVQDCFAEVNSTAATYANSVGVGANGFQVAFTPASGGPNSTTAVAANIQILNCGVDMVAMSSIATAACVNMWEGAVTNSQQLLVTIQNLRTKWLTSAGANDTGAVTSYESTTAPNYGYFGDIVFTGANNGGSQFTGRAKVLNCANDTGGVILLSSEINSQNAILEIANTRVSLRTGGATTNQGILNLCNCELVDYRGNIQFNYIFATGCFWADMDAGNADRTSWGSSSVGGTEFYFSNCRFQRRMIFTMGAGTTNNRSLLGSFNSCEWYLQFPWTSGGEPAITLNLGGSAFGTMNLNGCTFRNVGGQSSATGSMIVNNSASTLQINGAGNAYDDNYVSTGGHVIQYNSSPTYNDAPQTAAAPFNTVNGFRQLYALA